MPQEEPLLPRHIQELISAAEAGAMSQPRPEPDRQLRLGSFLWGAQADDSNRVLSGDFRQHDTNAARAQI